MALINITNIIVENNPCSFLAPFLFKITFECAKEIKEGVDWKLIYVGSSKDDKYDQILDSFSMDDLQAGVLQFQLQSNPPDYTLIPTKDDLFGITAVIISVSYKKQEFFRCGYYVYNNYVEQELLEFEPPQILLDRIQRSILADKPRITRYAIDWGINEEAEKSLYLGENLAQQNKILSDSTNLMGNLDSISQMDKKDGKNEMFDPFNPFNSNGVFNHLNNMPSLENSLMNNNSWNLF